MTDEETLKDTYDADWSGIDNDKIDQESLRILQEAISKSFSELQYLEYKKKDLLEKIRGQIYIRRQEYQGLANELLSRGFELCTRDNREVGLAVEEIRLWHPEHNLFVTADFSLAEMKAIGMVWYLPYEGARFDDCTLMAACTVEKDRVELADQLLTDTVQALEEIEGDE